MWLLQRVNVCWLARKVPMSTLQAQFLNSQSIVTHGLQVSAKAYED